MIETGKRALKRLVIARLRAEDSKRRAALTGEFGGLSPDLWGWQIDASGSMSSLGHSAEQLVHEFGTPLHIVNLPWLRRSHDHFIDAFRASYPHSLLATSYKTNPLPAVLQALHGYGTCAEVISPFELWLADNLGLPADRIIVNGPGKTREMIADAVRMRVKLINVDGLGEIATIADEANRLGHRQSVGVRVVTSVGWSSQFGLSISEGAALEAFRDIMRNPALLPIGLHLHLGTGIKSVAVYLRAIQEVLEFRARLIDELGFTIPLLDLGGGFGVPTVRSKDDWDRRMVAAGYPAREALVCDCPDPSEYAKRISELIERQCPAGDRPALVFEPGRAITSSAQTLLLRVIAVKQRRGVRQLILDGGKNITLPLEWETHKIFAAGRMREPHVIRTDLFGPLCHPGDIIARHLQLPELHPGDVVAVMDAGAYFIPNQMNFSNPRPAVVTIDESGVRLARARESYEDVVRLDAVTKQW